MDSKLKTDIIEILSDEFTHFPSDVANLLKLVRQDKLSYSEFCQEWEKIRGWLFWPTNELVQIVISRVDNRILDKLKQANSRYKNRRKKEDYGSLSKSSDYLSHCLKAIHKGSSWEVKLLTTSVYGTGQWEDTIYTLKAFDEKGNLRSQVTEKDISTLLSRFKEEVERCMSYDMKS